MKYYNHGEDSTKERLAYYLISLYYVTTKQLISDGPGPVNQGQDQQENKTSVIGDLAPAGPEMAQLCSIRADCWAPRYLTEFTEQVSNCALASWATQTARPARAKRK